MSEKDFQLQTETWASQVRSVAAVLPSLDFVGWHGEHYVVDRRTRRSSPAGNSNSWGESTEVELRELPCRRRLDCGKGVDLGTEDAAWLERKDVPMDYEVPGLE